VAIIEKRMDLTPLQSEKVARETLHSQSGINLSQSHHLHNGNCHTARQGNIPPADAMATPSGHDHGTGCRRLVQTESPAASPVAQPPVISMSGTR
jgi:hypothetical protein